MGPMRHSRCSLLGPIAAVVLKRNANVAPPGTSNQLKSFRRQRGRKRILIGASTRSAKSASGWTSALTSVERFEEWAVRHLSAVASCGKVIQHPLKLS